MVASPRHGRSSATRRRRGARAPRGRRRRGRVGGAFGRRVRRRLARVGRCGGHRHRVAGACSGPPRSPPRAAARRRRHGDRSRRGGPHRLGRSLDHLVDRRGPVVGVARARPRLRRVPRPRGARRRAPRRRAPRGRTHRRRARRRARLGPPRHRDPVALSGRRPDRSPARARRLLERPRAPGRRRDRVRPLDGRGAACAVACHRLPARLRRRSRRAPHPVACGAGRGGGGPRPVARALRRQDRGRRAHRGRRDPRGRRRRLGVHAGGPRGRRRAACRPRGRRPGVRRACARRRARRRPRRVACAGVPTRRRARPRRARTLVGVCVLALLAGGVALAAGAGNPFSWTRSQFSGGECVNEPGRLTELCANNRLEWWGESLDVAADQPVGARARDVRARAASSPYERDPRRGAPQRPATASRRPRHRRACARPRRRGRRDRRGPAARSAGLPAATAPRLRRSHVSSLPTARTRSSTTTSTSSR